MEEREILDKFRKVADELELATISEPGWQRWNTALEQSAAKIRAVVKEILTNLN